MKKFFADLAAVVNKVMDKGAELAGISAAHYRSYMEQENEKARKEVNARQNADMFAKMQCDYIVVAELLMEAINNTTEITHLRIVKEVYKLYTIPWCRKGKGGFWIFVYHGWYAKGFHVTARDIQRVLQAELNRLCDVYGVPRVTIRVSLGADGTVVFNIASVSDVQAAKNAQKIKI